MALHDIEPNPDTNPIPPVEVPAPPDVPLENLRGLFVEPMLTPTLTPPIPVHLQDPTTQWRYAIGHEVPSDARPKPRPRGRWRFRITFGFGFAWRRSR